MPPERIDSLDADGLKGLVLSLLAKIDQLSDQNKKLMEQIGTLLARIAELEGRGPKPPKTPTNSSLPPSRGQKANVADASTTKSRKGRPGVARELCPNPDAMRDIYAERCACGARVLPTGQALAHAYDHIELPPIRPVTTRINLHRADCRRCGKTVTATPPADMPPGSPFGPGIVALVANMLQRAARPFADAAEEIAAEVRASEVIASDETSARVKGKTWWQWTFGCGRAVYHLIAPTRGKCVPTAFLASARPKMWLSDRLPAQLRHAEEHQFCLAHLIRDAQYAIDHGDTIFAPDFKALLKDACAVGRRRPDLADATIAAHRRRLERQLERLLARKPTDAEGRKLRDAVYVDCSDKLFVFLKRRDAEPTNNESERALRPSVIFRKVTNGFRSEWGATTYAALCSIVETGRRNGRSPLAAIRDALAIPAAGAAGA